MDNLKYLNTLTIPYIIRVPIVPSLNDRIEHFEKLNNLIEFNEYFQGIEIMPYHILGNYKYDKLNRIYLLKDIKEPSKEEINRWKSYIIKRELSSYWIWALTINPNNEKFYFDKFEFSWGQFIARMTGNQVYNFSRGGMSAKEYIESFSDLNDLFIYWFYN